MQFFLPIITAAFKQSKNIRPYGGYKKEKAPEGLPMAPLHVQANYSPAKKSCQPLVQLFSAFFVKRTGKRRCLGRGERRAALPCARKGRSLDPSSQRFIKVKIQPFQKLEGLGAEPD
ncbi:MAG: hypothetical protein ACOX8S_04165 [Christensenellales bacterium]|jgi:hypothetical protein